MHKCLLLGVLSLTHCLCAAQVHVNAHAHNDYEHERPLFEALENGFVSIEADIYLVDGKLLVSHDHPTPSSRSLEELYLKPLDSIARANNGKIYPESDVNILLMIDIKSGAKETFNTLHTLLSKYRATIDGPDHKGAFRVFISGNRPVDLIRNDPQHLMSIDGRPDDIGKGFTEAEMPVISENFKKIINWNGKGTPSNDDVQTLRDFANRVHKENKKLRLWAIPDHEHAWSILLQCGVDLINTDRIKELNLFLTKKKL